MSSGPFTTSSLYLSDAAANGGDGLKHPIRIQPETLSLTIGTQANASPTGTAESPISAVVSRSQRALGLNARMVNFKFTEAVPNYKTEAPLSLPWLDSATFGAIKRGNVGTYQVAGTDYDIVVTGVTKEAAN